MREQRSVQHAIITLIYRRKGLCASLLFTSSLTANSSSIVVSRVCVALLHNVTISFNSLTGREPWTVVSCPCKRFQIGLPTSGICRQAKYSSIHH